MKPNFSKGLLPAVVIEEGTKEVLMLAYMNEEAYENAKTKRTWFYSRSRRSLWNKGETSGHVQHVQSLYLDCASRFNCCCRKASWPSLPYGRKTCFHYKII